MKYFRMLTVLLPLLLLIAHGVTAEDFQLRGDRPSRLVVYRPSRGIVGVAAAHVVVVNQYLQFSLRSGEYVSIDLHPGEYLVSAAGDVLGANVKDWDAVLLELRDGQVRYIQSAPGWQGVDLELQNDPVDISDMREQTTFTLLREE